MALGTNNLGVTEAGNFIPELWSDEVIATYKKNLVAANVVTKINHVGKKGDTIHIPVPSRVAASAKATDNQVTLAAQSNSVVNILLDKHYHYAVLLEDIAAIQALNSMRSFYTDDAGYALAKQVDTDILSVARNANGYNGTSVYAYNENQAATNAYVGSDGTTVYNGASSNAADLTDAAIRRAIQRLDDNDYPMDERALLISPRQKRVLLGISRFTEQAFVGDGNAIKTGQVGEIYGVPVFVTSNLDLGYGNTQTDKICLLLHKSAFAFAEQMSVRTQSQYKLEYLADLFTADTIYGVAELRDNGVVPLATPA